MILPPFLMSLEALGSILASNKAMVHLDSPSGSGPSLDCGWHHVDFALPL